VTDEDQRWIAELVDRLSVHFPQWSRDELTEVVHDCNREFVGSRIRDFVPILVERRARERLKEPAAAAPSTTIPRQRHEVTAETPVPQAASS
jgi:hypothetical protein